MSYLDQRVPTATICCHQTNYTLQFAWQKYSQQVCDKVRRTAFSVAGPTAWNSL